MILVLNLVYEGRVDLQCYVNFSCAVAQRVKHLPPMRETRVRSLGREDPLEKETVTYSSILAWRIPWMEKPRSPWGHKESDTTERLHFTSLVAELVKNPPAMWETWVQSLS